MSRKRRNTPPGSLTATMRDEFESSREWKLRKLFLDANVGSLSQDRLFCLSKCFINSAMYGCSYPRAVMEEVKSRSHGLLEEYQQEKKEDRKTEAKKMYSLSFVKASDSQSEEQPLPSTSGQSDAGQGEQPSAVEIVDLADNQGNSPSCDVSAIASSPDDLPGYVLMAVPPAAPVLTLQEYRKLCTSERHPLIKKLRDLACKTFCSKEEFALNKVMGSLTKGFGLRVDFKQDIKTAKRLGESYAMRILFNDTLVVIGAARSKALARKNGFEVALQKLYMPHLRVEEIGNGETEVQASMEPFYCGKYHSRHAQSQTSSLSSPTAPAGSTHPGKVLISSKDFLPSSHMQISQKASVIQVPKETLEAVQLAQREAKLQALDFPLTKNSSNRSSLEQRQDAGNVPLGKFILVLLSELEEPPVNILRRSADFSGMLLDIEHTLHSSASVACEVRLQGQIIGQALDQNTKAAKTEAARRALEYLGQHCWVLRLKGAEGTSTVSKDALFTEIQQRSEVIGEGNVGNKLLRKMGWSGGGVGKHGSGIVEPVAAQGVLGRSGLGLSSSSGPGSEFEERQFRQKVRTALQKYMASEEQEDLRFSPEFTKEERKIIHQEASRLHLRTVSRGKQDNRFLTVGHKRSSQQLLQHISECGGETNSYVLTPPGSYQPQTTETSNV